MFQYNGQIMRWVDGDTVWLDLDLGFHTHMQVDVRLAHVNAPDILNFGLTGLVDRALEYCTMMLPAGACLVADITRTDKYGRWLARIRYLQGCTEWQKILDQGKYLNDELLSRGLVRAYEGGKK